ncbi:MAG: TlpA family protein disulfide reductase [Verrucomicrobiales bacterium]|nr:TlpA family protein disulfide reductase [Verrucomicrobiales bacterium]
MWSTFINPTRRLFARALVPILLAVAALSNSAIAATPKVGEAFPDLTKAGLEGGLPDLSGKIVLVDFFASWCGPCQESFPAMEELQKKYGSKGLVIVAVNEDQKREDMDSFLKQHKVTFTIVRDPGSGLVSKVRIPTMPTSFLLDKEGKVRAMHRGFKGKETLRKYEEDIEALLK